MVVHAKFEQLVTHFNTAMSLTIQIFHTGQWHDAADLTIPVPEKGRAGAARLSYRQDYALAWLEQDDEHACSLTLPVELMLTHDHSRWFGFLEDIMPAGAARRYWTQQLGIADMRGAEQDFALLRHGCIAPVGNVRIKESLPVLPAHSTLQSARFTLADVVERHTDFLEYAQQMGAISGGATGAGGEAPKFLLRRSAADAIWIDTFQDDLTCHDAHCLVKFPRGQRSAIDCDILRTEYHFYQELHALGIATIDTAGMQLHEGNRYPSLWLPRFDVEIVAGRVSRHGLESIASVLNAPPGAFLNHIDALRTTLRCLSHLRCHREQLAAFDQAAFVIEWVKRDFLNVAFGNSDNHARNTALLKKAGKVWLAPVYDFAPMKADPEGIIRSLRWGSPLEEGGRFDWRGIALALADLVAPDQLLHELSALARPLVGLRERLQQRGVPERILTLPALGLETLDHRLALHLAEWGSA
jgi:serine/threonine-protein kinase HipA